ncbi:MAG: alcohol dehydrogenase [Ilumatobacter sp.]|jgi:alcohol dehydrogenase
MKAALYEAFGVAPTVQNVPDPTPALHGVVVKVLASGVCRSDWHAWGGHDPVIQLPHVPGHELAGTVEVVGSDVSKWKVGDLVTVPFVGGCGRCISCQTGNQQICDAQFQPGFTHWGSFAQYVGIHNADLNLVAIPEGMGVATAASLGCRFVTAFRAVVDQSRVKPGQWLAIHGCGGVGLSAIMIARAMGARVIGVDVNGASLAMAASVGADIVIDASESNDVVGDVRAASNGGVHVSIDALGIPETCTNSVRSLRKQGRHVQVGWMLGADSAPPIPMDLVMGNELEIVGSHGIAAHRYDDMLAMIQSGALEPQRLIAETITIDESPSALAHFAQHTTAGITVITDFG